MIAPGFITGHDPGPIGHKARNAGFLISATEPPSHSTPDAAQPLTDISQSLWRPGPPIAILPRDRRARGQPRRPARDQRDSTPKGRPG